MRSEVTKFADDAQLFNVIKLSAKTKGSHTIPSDGEIMAAKNSI